MPTAVTQTHQTEQSQTRTRGSLNLLHWAFIDLLEKTYEMNCLIKQMVFSSSPPLFFFKNKIIKGNERVRILLNWLRKMISFEVECLSFWRKDFKFPLKADAGHLAKPIPDREASPRARAF